MPSGALLARLRKRHGAVVPFDPDRIAAAVTSAALEVGRYTPEIAAAVTEVVVADLAARRFARRPPGVEDVQDAVERALMAAGLADVARAYVLYRRRRAELRQAKEMLGVREELKLGLGAAAVLKGSGSPTPTAEGAQGTPVSSEQDSTLVPASDSASDIPALDTVVGPLGPDGRSGVGLLENYRATT